MACRFIYDGSCECFCTEDNCNTKQILVNFLQNYQNGILDCYGSSKNITCPDSEDAVCYVEVGEY